MARCVCILSSRTMLVVKGSRYFPTKSNRERTLRKIRVCYPNRDILLSCLGNINKNMVLKMLTSLLRPMFTVT